MNYYRVSLVFSVDSRLLIGSLPTKQPISDLEVRSFVMSFGSSVADRWKKKFNSRTNNI